MIMFLLLMQSNVVLITQLCSVKEERSTSHVVQHVQTRAQVLVIKIQFVLWLVSKVATVLKAQWSTMENAYSRKTARASLVGKHIMPLHLLLRIVRDGKYLFISCSNMVYSRKQCRIFIRISST